MKIHTKLFIALIPLVALSIGFVAWNTYMQGAKAVLNSEEIMIEKLVEKTTNEMHSWFEDRIRECVLLSKNPLYLNVVRGDNIPTAQKFLDEIKKSSNLFENIYVTDKNTKVIMDAVGGASIGMMMNDVPNFRQFIEMNKAGTVAVTPVFKSPVTGRPVVVITAPIMDESKKFVGTLGTPVELNAFSTSSISKFKIGETGYLFLVDLQGAYVAHPDTDMIFKGNIKDTSWGEKMLQMKTGILSYQRDGHEWTAYFDFIEERGLTVAAVVSQDEFMGPVLRIRLVSSIMVGIAILIVAFVIYIISRLIVKPINHAVANLRNIAEGDGDLTMRLPETSRDEVGELSRWFNTFISKIQSLINEISGCTVDVDTASNSLGEIASQLKDGSENTAQQANNVAAAMEEMSTSLNGVAAAMEQSSANTSMVSSSADGISKTINRMAENAKMARDISSNAVAQSEQASDRMHNLGNAANAISRVTEAITEISEQINLLSLNATIEAARAGEAGKGFAVVANEIKDLAKQTAEATLDIKRQIDEVQNTTTMTVSDIEKIAQTINSIDEIVSSISTAVDEQVTSSKEIAENIFQASQGLQEVNENVTQISYVAGEVSKDINKVNGEAADISSSSGQVSYSAEQLKQMAVSLKEIVGQFKV